MQVGELAVRFERCRAAIFLVLSEFVDRGLVVAALVGEVGEFLECVEIAIPLIACEVARADREADLLRHLQRVLGVRGVAVPVVNLRRAWCKCPARDPGARDRPCVGIPCRVRAVADRCCRRARGRAARRIRKRSPSAVCRPARRRDELAFLKLRVEERLVLLRGRVHRFGGEFPLDRADRLDAPAGFVQFAEAEPLDESRVDPQREVPRVEQHVTAHDRVIAGRFGVEQSRENLRGRVVLLRVHARDDAEVIDAGQIRGLLLLDERQEPLGLGAVIGARRRVGRHEQHHRAIEAEREVEVIDQFRVVVDLREREVVVQR